MLRCTHAECRPANGNLYAVHGIHHYWIVDVDARTLEAFELVDHRWVLLGSYDHTATAAIPRSAKSS